MRKKNNIGSLLDSLSSNNSEPEETKPSAKDEKKVANPAIGLATQTSVSRAKSVKEPVLHLEHDQVILFKYHDRHLSATATSKVSAIRESIRTIGQQFPGVVRKTDKVTPDGRMIYELVCGRLRYEASRDIAEFQAFLRELDDREAARLMIIENEERQDITPFERWLSSIPLVKDKILTSKEIAELTKQDPGNFSRSLKAVDLYEECNLDDRLIDAMSIKLLPLVELGFAYLENKETVKSKVDYVRENYPQLMNTKFLNAVRKLLKEAEKPLVETLSIQGSKVRIKKVGEDLTLTFKGIPREGDFSEVIKKLRRLNAVR